MTSFFRLDFDIPTQEKTYLYRPYIIPREKDTANTGIRDISLKIDVKQNCTRTKGYYNTIKGGFFQLKDYNQGRVTRMISEEVYTDFKTRLNIGSDYSLIADFFIVFYVQKQITEQKFSLFFFDSRNQ